MSWRHALSVALVAAGCEPTPAPPVATATPEPEPQPVLRDDGRGVADLLVLADGAPLTIRSALAYTRGNQGIEVVFSTAAGVGCDDDLSKHGRDGELRIGVRLHQRYAESGELRWTSSYGALIGGSLTAARVVEVHSADAGRGGRVAARIDLELRGARASVPPGGRGQVELRGSFDALGCGDFPVHVAGATRQELAVEVGGERFVMLDARLVERDGHRSVRLSSQPSHCEGRDVRPDVLVVIDLAANDAAAGFGVAGDRFEGSITATADHIVKLSDVVEARGRWSATVHARETFGGVLVALDGRIDAMVCPRLPGR